MSLNTYRKYDGISYNGITPLMLKKYMYNGYKAYLEIDEKKENIVICELKDDVPYKNYIDDFKSIIEQYKMRNFNSKLAHYSINKESFGKKTLLQQLLGEGNTSYISNNHIPHRINVLVEYDRDKRIEHLEKQNEQLLENQKTIYSQIQQIQEMLKK
jgi:hypothetical protein